MQRCVRRLWRHVGFCAASSERALNVSEGGVSLFHQLGIKPQRAPMSSVAPSCARMMMGTCVVGATLKGCLIQPLQFRRSIRQNLSIAASSGGTYLPHMLCTLTFELRPTRRCPSISKCRPFRGVGLQRFVSPHALTKFHSMPFGLEMPIFLMNSAPDSTDAPS